MSMKQQKHQKNLNLVLIKDPTPVYQDNFTPSKGNALQACVASLFDQPLNRVPNFIILECGFLKGIQNFVGDSYVVLKKDLNSNNTQVDDGKLCILRGKSPRGDFAHVVIGRIVEGEVKKYKFIHDPHPDETFLDTSKEDIGWYMIFDEKE